MSPLQFGLRGFARSSNEKGDNMFCTTCGNEIASDASFCTFCGVKVAKWDAVNPMAGNGGASTIEQGEGKNKESFGYDDYGGAILNYIKQNPPETKAVFIGDAITPRLLADYQLKPGERPYAVVNKRHLLYNLRNYGLVITDRGILYRALGDGILQDLRVLFCQAKCGFVKWNSVEHFQVGTYDGFWAYYGHMFEINHKSVGLVRMGVGMCCDDKVTEFLNGLSVAMVEAGLLKDLPTEYECQ